MGESHHHHHHYSYLCVLPGGCHHHHQLLLSLCLDGCGVVEGATTNNATTHTFVSLSAELPPPPATIIERERERQKERTKERKKEKEERAHNLCGGREAPPPPPHYYLCVWVVVGAPPPIRSVSFKGLTTTTSNTSVSLDTFTSTIHLYFTSIAHLHKDTKTT